MAEPEAKSAVKRCYMKKC